MWFLDDSTFVGPHTTVPGAVELLTAQKLFLVVACHLIFLIINGSKINGSKRVLGDDPCTL